MVCTPQLLEGHAPIYGPRSSKPSTQRATLCTLPQGFLIFSTTLLRWSHGNGSATTAARRTFSYTMATEQDHTRDMCHA